MLELDGLHRSGDRLDPHLRGLVRWAAADANRCAYSREVAVADLRRAGLPESELRHLGDINRRSPKERTAMAFARRLMIAAAAVSDAEFKELLAHFGEEQTVAIVLLLAHASFQDRLLLAIDAPLEKEPPPPVTARFVRPKQVAPLAVKPAAPAPAVALDSGGIARDPEWLKLSFGDLRVGLQDQLARTARIRVPERGFVEARIGDDPSSKWQADIIWSRVCFGYQPELTRAWFECSAAIREDGSLDRMLTNLIFWVVTRAERCFY